MTDTGYKRERAIVSKECVQYWTGLLSREIGFELDWNRLIIDLIIIGRSTNGYIMSYDGIDLVSDVNGVFDNAGMMSRGNYSMKWLINLDAVVFLREMLAKEFI